MRKELRKSSSDKMLAGVCGGLADYFNISSTLIRLIFVILFLGMGSGLLVYIVAAIIMPKGD